MRKPILRLLKNNQYLNIFQKSCKIKQIFLSKKYPSYGSISSGANPKRTTRWVSACTIQGTPKRTLKVFGFNRHAVRMNVLKDNFQSLKSNS